MTIYEYRCEYGHKTVIVPVDIAIPVSVECHDCGLEAALVKGENPAPSDLPDKSEVDAVLREIESKEDKA